MGSYANIHITDPSPAVTVRVDDYGQLFITFRDAADRASFVVSPDAGTAGHAFAERLRAVADELDAWSIKEEPVAS
jgi:hypothetical protein